MQRMLPGDHRHEMYRTAHGGVSSGMELGAFALGGVGIAKGAYSLIQKGFNPTKRFALPLLFENVHWTFSKVFAAAPAKPSPNSGRLLVKFPILHVAWV